MLNVTWAKAQTGWWQLDTVDLTIIKAHGVYLIWHGGNPSRVVRIGQGDVASRLGAHRNDPAVTAHKRSGTLYVTWAAVSAAQRGGVERFLTDHYRPLVGDAFPDEPPIAVNLPA